MVLLKEIFKTITLKNSTDDKKACKITQYRVPTVREKSGKNEKISRSGKSQGILSLVREILNFGKSQGKVREF